MREGAGQISTNSIPAPCTCLNRNKYLKDKIFVIILADLDICMGLNIYKYYGSYIVTPFCDSIELYSLIDL